MAVEKAAISSKSGHRRRLREKFLDSGLAGFHDYEIIELLLTLATPRKDCKEAAKAAMARFKSLQGVIEAAPVQLCEIDGIGPRNLLGVKLIQAVADRYLKQRLVGKDSLSNSRELFNYLSLHLGNKSREHFMAILLDAKNNVIDTETLFIGTLTASSVYPREVVKSALNHHAAAVIFAHNHPSGDPAPSPQDLSLTRHLTFACRVVGIIVHEHLVVGRNRYFSFADQGHIARFNREYESTLAKPAQL